jgi:FixJ family two-component response regulator
MNTSIPATPASPAPRVFVVDDDLSVRNSLELLLTAAGWQPQAFASGDEFLLEPWKPGPSCLILDMALPGLDGLELQQRIAREGRDMPIIFITGFGDVPRTVRAMKAGAVELFTKPYPADELLHAVAHALERSRSAWFASERRQALYDTYRSLTEREREVMALVIAGLLNKQVGGQLGISEITVKAHRGKMMRKMQARSVPDLVRMAGRLGLAEA